MKFKSNYGKLIFKFVVFLALCPFIGVHGSVLVDDETEVFLKEIVYKIKDVLNYQSEINVYVLDNQELNAAATQNGDIVVNVGAILQCKNVKEMIAILAHEVAHVEGRHIVTFLSNQSNFIRGGLVTTLIGAIASVCAGSPAPFIAGVAGGSAIGNQMALAALRRRENMADTNAAKAIKLLKWPVLEGFVSLHKNLLSNSGMYNMYLSTHPQSKDRVSKFEKYFAEEKKQKPDRAAIDLIDKYDKLFSRVQHKLRALLSQIEDARKIYANPKDTNELYAKAIVLHRAGQYQKAIATINKLLESSDDNEATAYYNEIKTMSLINTKKCVEAADIASKTLSKCKKICNHRDLAIIYACAVVEGRVMPHCEKAIKILKKVSIFYKHDLSVWHMLGELYTMVNKHWNASLCAAESAFLIEDLKGTIFHAEKARSANDMVVKRRAADLIATAKEALTSNSDQ
ncbi:MAG: M48 family metalloprotease [Holosporales bacterium]|jgi:predicted Zn-dependent protease|nr:M48 family metalloprotease [Holosporales bacterium]